jgi:hypothetical protein
VGQRVHADELLVALRTFVRRAAGTAEPVGVR